MQFRDEKIQKKYDRESFVVIELLEESEVEQLREVYDSLPNNNRSEFYVSNYERDVELNQYVSNKIKEVFKNKLDKYLINYRTIDSAFFYVKPPTQKSSFYIHKDWNIVDETKYESMHIWIPLMDTNTKNGNLFICPFEKKNRKYTKRGSPGFEDPVPNFFVKLINRIYQKDIYTKMGQAVCFRHNLTHGSRTNYTDEVRVAAGFSVIFDDAPMIHYNRNTKGEIKKYYVNDDFYIDFDLNSLTK